MKTMKWLVLVLGLGLFALPVGSLHAQTASFGGYSSIATPIESAAPDSIVAVTAENDGLSLIAREDLPLTGTFWLVNSNGFAVPMPCAPLDQNIPIYAISDNVFLADGTGGLTALNRHREGYDTVDGVLAAQANAVEDLVSQNEATQVRSMLRASGMDRATPMDAGTSGTSSPDFSILTPDYGTNLWIAQWGLTNYLVTGLASNTLADVPYEIQTNMDLGTTNWGSTGLFVYGSELTNWTALPFLPSHQATNVFVRLKSWVSDGSGLPIWWQLQYFGTNGVDPYGNPAGDGYNNLQKFQAGMNPNQFYTPAAPQGVTVNYNANAGTAKISWLPAAGNVTGYTVTDSDGDTFNTSASVLTVTDNVSSDQPDPWNYGTIPTTYTVQAHYAAGNSTTSASVPLEAASFAGSITPGSQNAPILTIQTMPANTSGIRLTEMDGTAMNSGGTIYVTNFTISISSFSNGSTTLPDIKPPNQDACFWVGQAVGADGSLSASVLLGSDYNNDAYGVPTANAMTAPFYDARRQLKDNLVFQLRAAPADNSLEFSLDTISDGHGGFNYGSFGKYSGTYHYPTNYACAGLYSFMPYNPYYDYYEQHGWGAGLDIYLPYEENALFRNFVFDPADADVNGLLTTGATVDDYAGIQLAYNPTHYFSTNTGGFPNLLPATDTRWLLYDQAPFDISGNATYYGYGENIFDATGITYTSAPPDYHVTIAMPAGTRNWFGLPYLSALLAYHHSGSNPGLASLQVNAGNSFVMSDEAAIAADQSYYRDLYPETAQPQLQTVEYDFWNPNDGYWTYTEDWLGIESYWYPLEPLPGQNGFSTTNASNQQVIVGVGNTIQLAGYAKLALTNGYSGVYAYLGQYFDKAYKVDTNGNATTNQTGILSPYGEFFATEPGPTALVTMPDIDTGERGTCTVYTVSAVIDRSQAGNMDLSFNGVNATALADPAVIWCNNNMDRWNYDLLGLTYEQDDVKNASAPDSQYTTNGLPAIACTRDLEDYFRLWLPGLSAAMKAMPTNYKVQLALSGDGQIRIFKANESDGGTNYLFDETTASNQVAQSASLYVGTLTASSPISLPIQTNFNEHFIFCGAAIGTAQIDLQILDPNQNVVADAPVYLQINDIKNMYERWTVGDNSAVAPKSQPMLAADNLPDSTKPLFQYPTPQDTNMPYILHVHGYNMQPWEKDRFAETEYKRLYWQGYKGRFGEFRWPTTIQGVANATRAFDDSESNAWASAKGLLNLLTNLNAEYPGNVYLTAHSHGNVVAGEALKLAGNHQVVNTYIAMQGAVAAHAYDATAPTRSLGLADSGTPNRYAHFWTDTDPCYFNNSAGAGAYVNFFNTNDWALTTLWRPDQNLKPDTGEGYGYNGTDFYENGIYHVYIYLPSDVYKIFSYCDEARCQALGAQAGVGGAFLTGTNYSQVSLTSAWPPDSSTPPYSNHVWHSAEFRSDYAQRWQFWNQVLVKMKLK